jgi:hypothetical protein
MRIHWFLPMVFLCGCKATSIHTSFLSEVCIKPYKNYEYKTCNDIHFVIDSRSFSIPKGFKTDLASIPKIAWPIMSPAHSSLIRPAIVHDWFYKMTCDYNRKQTDLIFYHMLLNDGISPFRACIMYYAVRLFGWKFYNEDYCDDEFKSMDKKM